jgi:hypothetical protein
MDQSHPHTTCCAISCKKISQVRRQRNTVLFRMHNANAITAVYCTPNLQKENRKLNTSSSAVQRLAGAHQNIGTHLHTLLYTYQVRRPVSPACLCRMRASRENPSPPCTPDDPVTTITSCADAKILHHPTVAKKRASRFCQQQKKQPQQQQQQQQQLLLLLLLLVSGGKRTHPKRTFI